MRFVNALVAPLVEAWGEVKVQKARVVLSLVGVVAAVAAMSTVIALGDLIVQSNKEMVEAISGRSVTIALTPTRSDGAGSGGAGSGGAPTPEHEEDPSSDGGPGPTPVGGADDPSKRSGWSDRTTGVVSDPASSAMTTVAHRFKIPYWSRSLDGSVEFAELDRLQSTGSFRGTRVVPPKLGYELPQLKAVDPAYRTIYRLRVVQGRWLRARDVDQRVTPVVVNSTLWEYFGKPNVHDPWIVTNSKDPTQRFRVVGVVKSSAWDSPTVYAPFDGWMLTSGDSESQKAVPSMLVWSSPKQADQARTDLRSALTSVLGEGWQVSVAVGQDIGGVGVDGDNTSSTRRIVMIIGWVVILLGALGLLNVAIVTVRQRIREIGIRRAVGASAKRVFFSVFMESVVATFVAGVLGVAIAVVALRLIPLESLGIFLQDRPAFPASAAVAGMGIATAVGALCGIVPAFAAVRVRPIDAIRY